MGPVVLHLFTGSLAGIGKLPALAGRYRLVWAEPKTIATSDILYLWKLIKYYFTEKPLHFYYTNRKPLLRAFQRYLG